MKFQIWFKSLVAFSLLATAFIISGCSGGGGSSVPAELQGIDKTAVEGTFVPGSPRGGQTTQHFYLRFGSSGNSITGTANFDEQTNGVTTLAYSAVITNVQRTGTTTGTLSFDLSNFTAGARYQTMHWSGNYTWNGQNNANSQFTVTNGTIDGTFTGGGSFSNYTFSFTLLSNAPDTNFGGPWHGTISVEGLGSVDWNGTFTRQSAIATTAQVTVGTTQANISGRTTFNTFAGTFDATLVNPLLAGSTGVFFVKSEVGSQTMTGSVFIIDSEGSVALIGTVAGVRGAGGGPSLTADYYQGTITPSGQSARSFSLDVLSTNLSPSAQGAGFIIMPQSTPNVGLRVSQVDTTSGHANVTLINGTRGYTSISLDGTVTATTFSGTYSATLTAGGTQTGTFTVNKLSNVPIYNINGDWSGTATGQSGTPNNITATIFQTGDEFTMTSTQTVFGFPIPFTVEGYTIGNSFVGDFDDQITNPIPGSINGHFEGTIASNSHISGEFLYTATATGFGTTSDNGTFDITKN